MPRPRKFKVGFLNIVTHPHTPLGYVDLLQSAFGLQRIIPLDGDRRAYLGSCFPISNDPLDGLQGNIYRFLQINQDQPWLNMITGSEAEPDEIEEKVEIPSHLKPNFTAIRYNFFPKTHQLAFEITRRDPTTNKLTNFSPYMAEKFFSRLFLDNELRGRFPNVEVTIIQAKQTLNEIYAIATLRTLKIKIKRPNPNDGELEEEIERQLEQEHVDSLEREIKSKEDATGLQPTPRTKALAQIALKNGYVFGSGYDVDGDRKEYKTQDKPEETVGEYRPDEGQGYAEAFTNSALAPVDSETQ